MTREEIQQLTERIASAGRFVDTLRAEVGKIIIGQSYMLDRLLIGLLSNGHVLLEGVPGLAKTLTIKSLAQAIHADFSRIQFTPDLLPADVIGTLIYNQQRNEFVVRKGPIFANFILADEINRAPAKVQSALLEAMQERQVTIGDNTYKLDEPFLVLATQNPLDQEGTYPLPEAQVDRFIMKVVVGYPTRGEEQQIIRQHVLGTKAPEVRQVVSVNEIINARNLVREVYMDDKVEQYIIDIVFATRDPEAVGLPELKPLISYGSSPRGSINLALASRAVAFLNKRGYVIPEDVRSICRDVLRHRLGLTYEAEAENVNVLDIIDRIIDKINLPWMLTTAEIIKKVRELEIRSKKLATDLFTGEYHSAFKGRGMSFKEVREYAPGDDIRFIDWNVSARFGHPFSKVFEEERELTVMMLIDVSASSLFGTSASKKDIATEMVAVIAFSAISNGDKVGAILYSDKVEKYIPPRKGKQQALYIIRELLGVNPEGRRTRLATALRYFNNTTRQRSICFVLSDLVDSQYGQALKVVGRKHDLVGVRIYDKMDRYMPSLGMVRIEDAETGEEQWVDSNSNEVKYSYEQNFFELVDFVKELFRKAGCDLLHVRTDDDYVQVLQRFFLSRNR